jgi:acyl-CoA thioester hydrolase
MAEVDDRISPPSPTFHLGLRVYWEDTDAGGVVFYANYLKFLERARTEWLRSFGIGQEELRQRHGRLFVVSGVELGYRAPARLDDWLDVSVSVAEIGRASLVIDQQIRRGDAGGLLLCEGRIRVGCVDADRFRPSRIPPGLLALIAPNFA